MTRVHLQPSATKLHWLQALRGLAVLMVVFFHMAPHWALAPPLDNFVGMMRFGFAGVDLFFILSGFVVYLSAERALSPTEIWQFIKRRTLRIYLGYWPALLVVTLFSTLIFNADLPPLKKMIGSVLLLYPSLFDNWLPTAWSLTYELYFYCWIACIVCLPLRYRLGSIAITIMVLTLWNTFWLMHQPENVYGGGQPLRFVLTGYGVEFLAGALLAEIYKKFKNNWPHPALMLPLSSSLCFIGLAIGTTSHFFDRVEIMRVGSFGIFAMGLFLMALTLESSKFEAPKWLVLVGDASFSLYLLHPFLLTVAGSLRFRYLQGDQTLILIASFLLPIILTMVAILWFKGVEHPLMRKILHKR